LSNQRKLKREQEAHVAKHWSVCQKNILMIDREATLLKQ
jgi:hypothetical protein